MKSRLVISILLLHFNCYAGDSIPRFKVSLGVGYPNISKYYSFVKLYENQDGYDSDGIGPLHLKLEYKLNKKWSLGLNANYMSYNIHYQSVAFDPKVGSVPNEVKISSSSVSLNARANYYFASMDWPNKRWEFYSGLGLGYNFSKFDVTSQYEEYTPVIEFGDIYKLGFELSAGGRFAFSKHLAVYSELGFAKSFVQLGITGSF